MKTERQSNFELLRVIAMLMIVLIHANMYLPSFADGITRTVANGTIVGICNIGVTCFILISGYFGVRFSVRKLVKMELMMITYSLFETLIIFLFDPNALEGMRLLEQLLKAFLPFISRKYWFYSCYVCIFIFSGFIETFISAMSREMFKKLLVVMLLVFSVFPTFFYFEIMPDNGKGLVQMFMIYLIGRYIRLYADDIVFPRWSLAVFVGLWAINAISHTIYFMNHSFCKDNSITNIAMAIILFVTFKSFSFSSKVVNFLSKPMFAVFALNSTLVGIVFNRVGDKLPFFYVEILLVVGIFIACVFIGALRELILGKADSCVGEFIEKRVKVK